MFKSICDREIVESPPEEEVVWELIFFSIVLIICWWKRYVYLLSENRCLYIN